MTQEHQYDRARGFLNRSLLEHCPQMKALPYFKNREDFRKISFLAENQLQSNDKKRKEAIRDLGGTDIQYSHHGVLTFKYTHKFEQPKGFVAFVKRLLGKSEPSEKEFFVSIRFVKPGNIVFGYLFYSYAFHYLLSKIARSARLTVNEDGVFYRHWDGEKEIGNILVTTDFQRLMAALDLDFFRFVKGFRDYDEMFEFAATSRYFRTSEFTRARHKFWMREEVVAWIERKGLDTTKSAWRMPIERVAELFPEADLLRRYDELLDYHNIKVNAMKKFNGKTAMQLIPGLEGKAVKESMGRFLYSFPDKFDAFLFVRDNDVPTILSKFKTVNGL